MAKILVFNLPAHGHINPMLPVAEELVRRGHEVVFCSTEETRGPIDRTGARFVAHPAGTMTLAEVSEVSQRIAHLEPFLLDACHRLVPFAEDLIRSEGADLVIDDAMAPWGAIAARRTGVTAVTSFPMIVTVGAKLSLGRRNTAAVVWDLLTSRKAITAARARVVEAFGEAGGPPLVPPVEAKNLVFQSRELQHEGTTDDRDRWIVVGPPLSDHPRDDEPWIAPPGDGPLVFVSPGTANRRGTKFFREVFRAFGEHPGRFVMFAGRGTDLSSLTPFPANFTVSHELLPQLQILEQADAFVTHGGMNSIQEALDHGVPLIMVPKQLEQLTNARRVQDLGAGVALGDQPPYGRVKAKQLRRALDQVLGDERFRQRARELGEAGRAAGGHRRAVDELEQLLLQDS